MAFFLHPKLQSCKHNPQVEAEKQSRVYMHILSAENISIHKSLNHKKLYTMYIYMGFWPGPQKVNL